MIACHVSHYRLECIWAVWHGCSWATCIYKHGYGVVSIFRWDLLNHKRSSVWCSCFQSLIVSDVVQVSDLLEEMRGDICLYGHELWENLIIAVTNISHKRAFYKGLYFVISLVKVVLIVDQWRSSREIIGWQISSWIVLRDKIYLRDVKATNDKEDWEEKVHEKAFWISNHNKYFLFGQRDKMGAEVATMIRRDRVLGQFLFSIRHAFQVSSLLLNLFYCCCVTFAMSYT